MRQPLCRFCLPPRRLSGAKRRLPSSSSSLITPLLLLLWVFLLSFGILPHAAAQNDSSSSEEEQRRRREQFLRAREQMRALPPSPSPNRSAAKPTPAPAPTPTAAATPTPTATPAASPGTPYGWNVPRPMPRPAPTPTLTPPAVASPAPTPPPASPSPPQTPPTVVIEKSGQEPEEEEPAETPTPAPTKRGFFARLFGFGGGEDEAVNYRFLTRRVLDEINRAPVRKGRWKYTVVHNSGTRQGSAAAFDYYHRHVRHMPNGLAYHFVIGNGTTTRDGQIEIGDRWRRQINGGHVHSDYLNNIALGICLVGDFNRAEPTAAQRAALDELITYLRKRVGRVDRRLSIVKAHREINPVPTDCPGNRFPYGWLHKKFD
ncbi:MAG: N-acetylmuramoyl-L-alanine amidase [Verrucomicrobia bacterium]|nr:N-acetylmuramoyl-L-alanine amidase [Verrucomicrobiota bacterium]